MIDTHAHIDDSQYQEDFDAFIAAQKQAGVQRIIVPGINADSVASVADVCSRYPDFLFPAAGLHPEEVKEDWASQLQIISSALDSYDYIAIGEIGLDYYWDRTYVNEQKEVLRRQLAWALDRDKPVIIHSREATDDILSILREFPGLQGVFHCFTGSRETADILLKMGFYLGIGGVLTFKNCKLRETLATVPLDRILLETDSPYMAPVPYRGKRNESRFMIHVAQLLSDVYQVPVHTIDKATTANALRLFWEK